MNPNEEMSLSRGHAASYTAPANDKATAVRMAHDLVVRGGTVYDGTGAKGMEDTDVAIDGGVIAAVGRGLPNGRQEVDARGRIVTPGFVDVHTHYDGQASWESHLKPSGWHGVTTAVMGNCGVGFAPVRPEHRELLIQVMEGVEDIPGPVLHEGLQWSWESFPDYLEALAGRARDIDVCAQVPHAALRVYVMGERAARLEEASAADVAQMRALAADAIRAGAVGFSTSRTLIHKTATGQPLPTLHATEHELTQIALGLRDAGGGVLEYRTDFDTPERRRDEFGIMRRIVEASGQPLTLSLFQENKTPDGWRDLLDMVEAAWADGLPLRAQVAPRQLGVLLGLQGTENPFCNNASYLPVAKKPLAERVAILRDPAMRARILAEPRPSRREYAHMFRMDASFEYAARREWSIPAIAEREGRTPGEVAYDLLLEDEGRNFIYYAAANYTDFGFGAVREMLGSPASILGLGDAGAHVTTLVDASYPTFFLSHWARDAGSDAFELPAAIRRLTMDNAEAMGLADRGVLRPGLKADLNVIDFPQLRCERPFMAFDLPAGGHRLLQKARGYTATIVSGQVVYRDGEATGALPGRLVRGPAAARR
jgi:N-acyl-D-aspartate/D-glutamate deacylase